MSHLAERFEAAVRTLVGDGTVKQRLDHAYTQYLADLQEADLPSSMRATFAELDAALRKIPPAGKGASSKTGIKMTVQKMSLAEAAAHAATIARLCAEVIRSGDRAEPLKIVQMEDKPPRYLSSGS